MRAFRDHDDAEELALAAAPVQVTDDVAQRVSRPITSTTITRWCADAVVWSRSSASVTTPTAVSKPMQNSVTLKSLSIVLGTPTV
jgi:cell division septation protein DedD